MSEATTGEVTRDRMRADIARVLRLDPAEIGDDDDLADLGLDSLRSMSLLLAWEKAGLALDFGALAECPTLAHWAAVAARSQNNPGQGNAGQGNAGQGAATPGSEAGP